VRASGCISYYEDENFQAHILRLVVTGPSAAETGWCETEERVGNAPQQMTRAIKQ
jgi:hypothetical protein